MEQMSSLFQVLSLCCAVPHLTHECRGKGKLLGEWGPSFVNQYVNESQIRSPPRHNGKMCYHEGTPGKKVFPLRWSLTVRQIVFHPHGTLSDE